jgi:ArsR family transcriptional regulator, arsenate/arsenite/antimonite-responsive transcriptional repressor
MMEVDQIVSIAKAIADPTRIEMLRVLRRAGSMTCTQVCEHFELSQPTISHHIRTLEKSGLISIRKDGPFHLLTPNEDVLAGFAGVIVAGAPARTSRRAGARPARARKR